MTSASAILGEVLETGIVKHPDGRAIPVVANISRVNSNALCELVQTRRPKLVVEIGMAYGVSTLSILSGPQPNGSGRLISVDPYIGWPIGTCSQISSVSTNC